MNISVGNSSTGAWTRELVALVMVILALLLAISSTNAQEPELRAASTAQGIVRSFTTAPMGEVDGAMLQDGTVVHWPPHLADRFTAVVTRGDRVKVSGWMESGAAGDTHLEVQRVVNLRTSASAENDFGTPSPPPGPRPGPLPPAPAPGPARPGASSTVEGRVASLTTAPMGEVDGANLDDGTILHWPPDLADRFTAVVVRGDRVRAVGWTERGPAGDTHFEVQSATNLRTNSTASGDAPASAQGPRGRIAASAFDGPSPPSARPEGIEARLKVLEDEIRLLREEIRNLRGQP